MMAASALLISQPAMAEWGTSQEKIAGHDTWVFVPKPGDGSGKLLDGKRALVINLHGCAQSATELKGFGNWDPTATTYGLYVAIPDVGVTNSYSFGCWDYRDGADLHQNASDLVSLASAMKSRFPDIDPNQVYITGLSSGAAMALLAACKAPDVFAGVGAIAGPSVGSNQDAAFSNPLLGNVDHALAKCKDLAGAKVGAFGPQIASVGYGDLDKNGGGTMPVPPPAHGVKALVPVEWTKDDAQVLAKLYQPCSFGGTRQLPDGKAEETLCTSTGGQQRVSLLKLFKVGHAWPAGSGDTSPGGGDWINKVGTNYPAYVTGWFFTNNPRVERNRPPEVSIGNGTVSGTTVTVVGSAEDPDPADRITEVSVKLAGRFPQPGQMPSGIKPWSATFPGVMNDACYTPEATAKDTKGAAATAVGVPIRVGNPPSGQPLSLTVSASLEGACIEVAGTVTASECASVQKVEVALGNRGFEQAELKGQDYAYHECGLPGGTYSTAVKATDSDNHDTLASGPTIKIDPVIPLTAQFSEHVVSHRIRMYAAPCGNTSFGTCDADIPTIISKHSSGPFSLYHLGTSDVWYLDRDKAQPHDLVVNINSASVEELDGLDGIGKTRAAAVISGRPYSGPEELVSKHILPKNVYDAIKDKIVVGQR